MIRYPLKVCFVFVMVFVAVVPLGGCSIPRSGELCLLGHLNSPLPQGASIVSFEVDSRLLEDYPSVEIIIKSNESSDALWEFYRGAFTRRGWKLTETSQKPIPDWGEFWCLDSRLLLSISDMEDDADWGAKSKARIYIETHHFWDWPSRWLQTTIAKTIEAVGGASGSDFGRFLWGLP